jgi:low affinity Fe/Cu permease
MVVAVITAAVIVALAATDFPAYWASAFSVAVASITLVMVFIIQHTQGREQTAAQLKLDELIRALPRADDHLVRVEAAQDEELADIEQRHTEHHESVRTLPED